MSKPQRPLRHIFKVAYSVPAYTWAGERRTKTIWVAARNLTHAIRKGERYAREDERTACILSAKLIGTVDVD